MTNMNNMKKIQYWKGMTMMGLVSAQDAEEIKRNAKVAGFKVYDNGHYFVVEEATEQELKQGYYGRRREYRSRF